MGVQHQWAAQRNLTAPPTSYAVVGPSNDPWLAAAGLAPGDVIPGVPRKASGVSVETGRSWSRADCCVSSLAIRA
jgi:hypothetical protein